MCVDRHWNTTPVTASSVISLVDRSDLVAHLLSIAPEPFQLVLAARSDRSDVNSECAMHAVIDT